jgi:hypothetical protein
VRKRLEVAVVGCVRAVVLVDRQSSLQAETRVVAASISPSPLFDLFPLSPLLLTALALQQAQQKTRYTLNNTRRYSPFPSTSPSPFSSSRLLQRHSPPLLSLSISRTSASFTSLHYGTRDHHPRPSRRVPRQPHRSATPFPSRVPSRRANPPPLAALWAGHRDAPLTNHGMAQATRLGEAFKTVPITGLSLLLPSPPPDRRAYRYSFVQLSTLLTSSGRTLPLVRSGRRISRNRNRLLRRVRC